MPQGQLTLVAERDRLVLAAAGTEELADWNALLAARSRFLLDRQVGQCDDGYVATITRSEVQDVGARLAALRQERDELVAVVSWMDEVDLLVDVLGSLRQLEGEIARLERRSG